MKRRAKRILFERVEKDQILSDFGGIGPSFDEILQEEQGLSMKRRMVELMSVAPKGKKKFEFELSDGETARFEAYTRSISGGNITIYKFDEVVEEMEVKRENMCKENLSNGNAINTADPEPYRSKLESVLKGPASYKVIVETKLSEGKEQDHFLLVGDVH